MHDEPHQRIHVVGERDGGFVARQPAHDAVHRVVQVHQTRHVVRVARRHVGAHVARTDDTHADAIAVQVAAKAIAPRAHCSLGCRVCDVGGESSIARNRSHDSDLSPASLLEPLQQREDSVEQAVHVGGEQHPRRLREVFPGARCALCDTCVRNHEVHRVLVVEADQESLHCVAIHHVHHAEAHLSATLPARLCHCAQPLLAATRECQNDTLCSVAQRKSLPDA
mmetsp:Transcript_4556/g.14716  ORF Transcript_4556/g.14716 Transcript_4556/m.14716 type:complete len:224 (+) Transcript_4556:170-841(+)